MGITIIGLFGLSALSPLSDVIDFNFNENRTNDPKSQGHTILDTTQDGYQTASKPVDTQSDNTKIGKDNGRNIKGLDRGLQLPNNKLSISDVNSSSQILMNETFDLIGNTSGNTTNSFSDTTNNDFISLDSLTNYNKESGHFNVSNIKSANDHKILEDDTANKNSVSSNTYRALAMSVTITETINITSVQTMFAKVVNVQGEFYFVGSSGGTPNTTVYGGAITLPSGSSASLTSLSYPTPLTLTPGDYFAVLNETSNNAEEFFWYFTTDIATGDAGSLYNYDWIGSGWLSYGARDMYLTYEYQILNPSNFSELKSFSSPDLVNLEYNGTIISNSNNNNLLLNGNVANFTTNTSVTFDLDYKYSFSNISNPNIASSSFYAVNNTNMEWNVTFSHNNVTSEGNTIKNRNITFYNIPTDWNATQIYANGTLWSNDPDGNSTIFYTNQTSSLTINVSIDLNAYDWRLVFVSPNYLASVSLSDSGGGLTYPYTILSNDTLDITASLLAGNGGGKNGSLLFYDYNDQLIHTDIDNPASGNSIPFGQMNLATNLSTTQNPNGTYSIDVQWVSADFTKVGFMSLQLTVITATAIATPTSLSDVINSTSISLNVNYTNFVNKTTLNGATVYYNASWGPNGSLSQAGSRTNYTGSVDSSTPTLGSSHINITAQLANHVTQIIRIFFNIVQNTSLSALTNGTTGLTASYYDQVNVSIPYLAVPGNSFISSATIYVNNTPITANNGNSYYYLYNTSDLLDPSISSFIFEINASKTDYFTRNITISVTLIPTTTTFNVYGGTPANNGLAETFFSYLDQDNFTFTLEFYDDRHNMIVNGSSLSVNDTSSIAISGDGSENGTGMWELEINPLVQTNFTVDFTFSKVGYITSIYRVNFYIKESNTSLLIDKFLYQKNGSVITWSNGNSHSFIYHNGTLDNVSIDLTLYDTQYGQNILSAKIDNTTSPYYSALQFSQTPNGTGGFNLVINPDQQTTFTVWFTLYLAGYQNRTFLITLVMLERPTIMQNGTGGTWDNSTIYNINYHDGNQDNVTFTLEFNDTYWNELVTGSTITHNLDTIPGLSYNASSINNATRSFTVYGEQVGNYLLIFTFNKSDFQTVSIEIRINILSSDLYVVNDLDVLYTNRSTVEIFFNSGNLDEETFYLRLKNNETNTYVNIDFSNTDNVTTSFPSTSDFLRTISYPGTVAGQYTFDALKTGNYSFSWTFTLTYYNQITLVLWINVSTTPTTVFGPYNNNSVQVDYDELSRDFLIFTFVYQDTNKTENVTGSNLALVFSGNTVDATVYMVNIAPGVWNISIDAHLIGTHTIGFNFTRNNYQTQYIFIDLVVNYNNVTILNGTGQQWTDTTYNKDYHEFAKDNISVSFVILSTNYSVINPTAFTNETSLSGIISIFDNSTNDGNYTLFINPQKIGTFLFTMSFSKYGYINHTITITVIISVTNTQVLNSTSQTWVNVTHVRDYNQGQKDRVNVTFIFQDLVYNDYLTNGALSVTTTSNYNVGITPHGNGSWSLQINPLVSGNFVIPITLEQYGYENHTFFVLLSIAETATSPIYGIVTLANGTTVQLFDGLNINQIFSEGNNDEFWFLISGNDTIYNEIINTSVANSTSLIYSITTTQIGNNTWNITVNPTQIGNDTFTFTLFHPGYSNVTVSLNLFITRAQLVISFDQAVTQNIEFGNNLTITAFITSNFDNSNVSSVSLFTNSSYFSFRKLSDGEFELTYYRARLYLTGNELINLTLYNMNFDVNTTFWNFTVVPRSIALVTTIIGTTSYSDEWANNFTVNLEWVDPDTGFKLNDTVFSTIDDTDVRIIFNGVVNGMHTFTVMIKNPGTVTKTITLDNVSLSSYFGSASIQLTLTGFKRTSALIRNITNSSITLYYDRNQAISIDWYDIVLGQFVTMSTSTISNTNWVQFTNQSTNNLLYFNVYTYEVDTDGYQVNITINSARYTSTSFLITITSLTLPTNPVSITLTQGLYADNANTSKLGYTLNIDVDWTVNDTLDHIVESSLAIAINGTTINSTQYSAYGVTVFSRNSGNITWIHRIKIIFLPENGYSKGFYLVNISLAKYGYINKTTSLGLTIKGFDIKFVLDYDTKLTRGGVYTITATVYYVNDSNDELTLPLYKLQSRFKVVSINGVTQGIGSVVGDLVVNFAVQATLLDGTQTTFSGNSTTSSEGIAFFKIDGKDTSKIKIIDSITVGASGDQVGEFAIEKIPAPQLEIVVIGINPLFIAIPIVIILTAIFISLIFIQKRRTSKISKKNAIYRSNMDRLDIISSVYSIMLTTSAGLPVITKINAIYSKSKAVEELISGLSVGIDTFLSSFQSDFLTKLGSQEEKAKSDPNNPHQVYLSSIKRNKFHVLIVGSPNYRSFIFLKHPPSKFVEQLFFKVVEKIQANVVLDVVFDEDVVKNEVLSQITKVFPFSLLDKFVLNGGEILKLSKSDKFSKTATDSLKRLFVITKGLVGVKDSAQNQIKEFNKLLKKASILGKASGDMGTVKTEILFYNVCYTILQEQLHLPEHILREIFWDIPLVEQGIFEIK